MENTKFTFNTIFPKILVWTFLLLVCIYCLIPFVWMLSTSLKTEAEAFRIPPAWIPDDPTVDSYIGIWVRKNFGIYFFNSTVISLATAVLSTFFGALAGYGFSRFFFKGRKFLIGFFLATQMLPGVLLVGPYFKILNRFGLYDTRTGLIVAFLTICLPFSTWMMKGFIDKVPQELDHSAMVDGCSRMGIFFKIVLPIVAPGMVATILFAFLLAWGGSSLGPVPDVQRKYDYRYAGDRSNGWRVQDCLADVDGRLIGGRNAGHFALYIFATTTGSGLDRRSR